MPRYIALVLFTTMNLTRVSTVSSATFITIGTVMSILFVLAFVGNILVLIVYRNNPKLHTQTNFWIMSVIICDLLIVVNAFPFVIVASFAEEYIFGDAVCQWDGFIVTMLGTSSIFLFTGLSIHRYQIMDDRIRAKQITKTQIFARITACYAIGLVWGVLPLAGWGSFSLEGIQISCAPDWRSQRLSDMTFTICMYFCVLFIPLVVIGYCYSKIILKIWRAKRNDSAWIKGRQVDRDIQVTVTVALTIGSFLVSWTPYATVGMCKAFFAIDIYHISPMLVQLPCLMAKTACIWNPIVYVCRSKDFREAFVKHFRLYRMFPKKTIEQDQNIENNDNLNLPKTSKGLNHVFKDDLLFSATNNGLRNEPFFNLETYV